jgi:uncharacterized tellurite resistance protein B-like protein
MWNADDFRLPEESLVEQKIRSHAGIKKLEMLFPETLRQEIQGTDLSLDMLMNEGVRITKSSRPDIFEIIENSLSMFGHTKQPFDVFAQKNLTESENAVVFVENKNVIFVFIHDILKTFTPNEVKYVIGHEVGHFSLGHNAKRLELSPVWLALEKAQEVQVLGEHPDLMELMMYFMLLPQLQELGADRIGLLVAQDRNASISGLVKLHGGFFSDNIDIDAYIEQAKKARPLSPEDLDQSHPYGPKRSWALDEFYKSDLFNKAFGKEGGTSIKEFSKLLRENKIIAFPSDMDKGTEPSKDVIFEPDDYILELIFYFMIAEIDGKATNAEVRAINNFFLIPTAKREELAQRWENIVKGLESKPEEQYYEYYNKLAEQYYSKAAGNDSRWKTKFIKRLIKVAKADRRIYEQEINKIIEIAEKINAKKECSRQFLKEFGYVPFA